MLIYCKLLRGPVIKFTSPVFSNSSLCLSSLWTSKTLLSVVSEGVLHWKYALGDVTKGTDMTDTRTVTTLPARLLFRSLTLVASLFLKVQQSGDSFRWKLIIYRREAVNTGLNMLFSKKEIKKKSGFAQHTTALVWIYFSLSLSNTDIMHLGGVAPSNPGCSALLVCNFYTESPPGGPSLIHGRASGQHCSDLIKNSV